MRDNNAFPVIFFILSMYAFGVALLYSLARAWEQALSPRKRLSGTNRAVKLQRDETGEMPTPSPLLQTMYAEEASHPTAEDAMK